MSFRKYKRQGLPVVRIGGIPYVLDMIRRQLRGVHDSDDVIDLEGEGCIEVDAED